MEWQELHTENQGGASQKNQADENSKGGHRSAIWRTGHAANRANIQLEKQMVLSYWHGRSSTLKIEEEALQKNQVDETSRGRHRSAILRTGHAADRANIQKQMVLSCWRGRSMENQGGGFAKESGR